MALPSFSLGNEWRGMVHLLLAEMWEGLIGSTERSNTKNTIKGEQLEEAEWVTEQCRMISLISTVCFC